MEDRVGVARVEVRYGDPPRQEYRDLWVLRFADDGRVEDYEKWAYWPGKLHWAPTRRRRRRDEGREVLIRPAAGHDWSSMWPFMRRIVADGETYSYDRDLDSGEAKTMWMLAPPGHTVVAVDADSALVGTAKMHRNQGGPGSHVATASFMVDPERARRGTGRALGEYALAWARSHGFSGMQFNAVVETNTAAVNLWTSLGFSVIGTVPGAFRHPRHGDVGLHVMFRRL